jgi:hypothetical protein
MTESPKLSVVMPVFNAERFLREAVESILNQTFTDFEMICINDASTDNSLAILEHYQQSDSRIRLYSHPENKGPVAALNLGCTLADGTYIAIMHSDDISHPERFARQLSYLDSNPEVGILGSWIEYIDRQGVVTRRGQYPTLPALLKWIMPFYDPLAHPAVMMRREVVAQAGYYQEGLITEDYELWARCSRITRLANIPEYLLSYRIWGESWTDRNLEVQEQNANDVSWRLLTQLLGTIDPATVKKLRLLAQDQFPFSRDDILKLADVIVQMYGAFCNTNELNAIENRAVAQDAANKLYILASQAFKYSKKDGLILIGKALKISPLRFEQIKRGTQRLLAGNRGSSYRKSWK